MISNFKMPPLPPLFFLNSITIDLGYFHVFRGIEQAINQNTFY